MRKQRAEKTLIMVFRAEKLDKIVNIIRENHGWAHTWCFFEKNQIVYFGTSSFDYEIDPNSRGRRGTLNEGFPVSSSPVAGERERGGFLNTSMVFGEGECFSIIFGKICYEERLKKTWIKTWHLITLLTTALCQAFYYICVKLLLGHHFIIQFHNIYKLDFKSWHY